MNPNACTDTTTFAQYMDNNLHLFCIGECYINLFPHFPKNDGKAFEDLHLFGDKNLIQIKTYDNTFYFQLKMED